MQKTIKQQRLSVGLLINPFAGIGGESALKGSDGDEIRSQALAYSKELRAPQRAMRFLQALNTYAQMIDWYVAKGVMGEVVCESIGVTPKTIVGKHGADTSASDTKAVAQELLKHVDILLFIGGDGTARDVLYAVNSTIPCLGIPSGVKMQSGVFALSPEAAADIVIGIIDSQLLTVSEQDVRDIDEEALRQGRVRSHYFGSMRVPSAPAYLQHLKQSGVEDETMALEDIAAHLTDEMQEGRLMLVGPGRTLAYWMESIGLSNTLVGFDAVLNGKLIQADLNGRDVIELQKNYPDLLLILSPTGQQGMLIGRGNQQLTPDFLRHLNKEQWRIVASKNKLATFNGKPLIVDSNDYELDKKLCGLYNVISAYRYQVLYPVNITYKIE
jgi:predicted polyphosphate/ATP-dependent NAD kinase